MRADTPRDPEEFAASADPTEGEISPATTLGEVHLTVSDLQRSIRYYRESIGLRIVQQSGDRVSLGVAGAGDAVLVLVEEPGAQPSDGHTGLYHFALLVPERTDLARWLVHAFDDGVSLTGASDHCVSEALYLRDPDGHGIEIYSDRPREAWEGQVGERMTTLPLDVEDLIAGVEPAQGAYAGLADGTVMGHVHLKVSDVEQTVAFYRDVLGFGLMAQLGAQAAFLSAGGYHHHIGANTWESRGAGPPLAGQAALRHATIRLPDETERERLVLRVRDAGGDVEETDGGPLVRDPSGNALLLAIAG